MARHHKGAKVTQDEINAKFSYDLPTPEQVTAINDVIVAGKILAETVLKHVPDAEKDKAWIVDRIMDTMTDARDAILYPEIDSEE